MRDIVATVLEEIRLHLRAFHADVILCILAKILARPMIFQVGRTTVIAPHQDDATFGCGGLIALRSQNGSGVQVIYLTDGSRAPLNPDGGISREDLPGIRIREARTAMSELGVSERQLHFLGFPDGELKQLAGADREVIISRLADLLAQQGAEEVLVTHADDGHGDHEAAFELVMEAVKRTGLATRVLQYLIWKPWLHPICRNAFFQDLRRGVRLSINSVQGRKVAAIGAYSSQLATLPRGFVKRFQRPYELFIRNREADLGE